VDQSLARDAAVSRIPAGAEARPWVRKFRFLAVGATGFLYEAVLLALFQNVAGWHPFTTRCFSLPTAIVLTWWLNRLWTFESRDPGRAREFGRYLLVQIIGNGLNMAVFLTVTTLAPVDRWWAAEIGLVFGSAIGLVVNFVGARIFAFRQRQSFSAQSGV
jgi:putative flippase GtrA